MDMLTRLSNEIVKILCSFQDQQIKEILDAVEFRVSQQGITLHPEEQITQAVEKITKLLYGLSESDADELLHIVHQKLHFLDDIHAEDHTFEKYTEEDKAEYYRSELNLLFKNDSDFEKGLEIVKNILKKAWPHLHFGYRFIFPYCPVFQHVNLRALAEFLNIQFMYGCEEVIDWTSSPSTYLMTNIGANLFENDKDAPEIEQVTFCELLHFLIHDKSFLGRHSNEVVSYNQSISVMLPHQKKFRIFHLYASEDKILFYPEINHEHQNFFAESHFLSVEKRFY